MLTAPIGQLSPVYCTVVSVSSAPSQSAVSSCISLALWSTRRKRTVRLIFFSTFSSLPICSCCPGTSAFLPGFSTISPVGSGSSVRFTRFVAIPISRFIGLSTTMVERTLPSPFSDTFPDAPRISSLTSAAAPMFRRTSSSDSTYRRSILPDGRLAFSPPRTSRLPFISGALNSVSPRWSKIASPMKDSGGCVSFFNTVMPNFPMFA